MKSSVETLLANPAAFLAGSGAADEVVISSRIRLARNLAGHPFPGAADAAARRESAEVIAGAVEAAGLPDDRQLLDFEPEELSTIDRGILLERHLASPDLLKNPEAARLIVRQDEGASVMVNEEDQLRIQVIRPGFCLPELWQEINAIDDALAARLDFAFDDRLGYLTACPTNVGTGMRASVMLHLPGLVLSGQIWPTIQGIGKLNLAVRGIFGEGSDHRGNLFQISNQSTLGESEDLILERLQEVIRQISAHEKKSRTELLRNDQNGIFDYVGRAFGVLRHSYKLSSEEALKCLSAVRFGVDSGLFRKLDVNRVNELFIAIGPAHLQKRAGGELSSAERDICRAALCREKLKDV